MQCTDHSNMLQISKLSLQKLHKCPCLRPSGDWSVNLMNTSVTIFDSHLM